MEALQRLHNRGSISTGYDIDNSLKVEADNSEYAEYAITSTTDRRNFCFSGWVKRTELVNSTDGGQLIFASFTEGNEGVLLRWSRENSSYYNGIQVDIGQGGTNYRSYTSSLYRDTAAWYHIVLAVNTRENTASDRWKLYVNGEQVTSWAQQQFPTADFLTGANLSGSKHTIGAYETGGTVYGKNCGYFADFHFIDADGGNVTFLPTSFGEYDDDSGIWIPKAYTGSYGTNGFYLDFESSGSLGADSSGNSNNFTLNNITAADQATDTPTNNFCTWSPLWAFYRNSTITEGGTEVAGAGGGWSHAGASMGVMNGRWYWEWKITSSEIGFISFSTLEGNLNLNQLGHDNSVVMGYSGGNLYTWLNGSQGSNESTGWGTWAVNDIIGIYLDLENSDRRFTLYKNGSAISGSTSFPVSFPNAMQVANGGGNIFPYNVQYENDGGEWNFGGYTTMSNSKSYNDADGNGSFVYNPVLGGVNYYALCTKNLEEYG